MEDKKYFDAKRVAKELGVPVEMLKYNFQQYEKVDSLKKDVDYIVTSDGTIGFAATGVLWALTRCGGQFRNAKAMLAKLCENKADELAAKAGKERMHILSAVYRKMTSFRAVQYSSKLMDYFESIIGNMK